MRGPLPPHPQYVLLAWCLIKDPLTDSVDVYLLTLLHVRTQKSFLCQFKKMEIFETGRHLILFSRFSLQNIFGAGIWEDSGSCVCKSRWNSIHSTGCWVAMLVQSRGFGWCCRRDEVVPTPGLKRSEIDLRCSCFMQKCTVCISAAIATVCYNMSLPFCVASRTYLNKSWLKCKTGFR